MSNGHCPSAMGKPQGNSISFFSIQKAKVLFPDYWIRHTHRHSLFLCMECVPMINENHVGKINVGFHFANFNFRFCVRKSLIKRTLTCSFSGFGQKFHTLDFKATYQILFALCWIHLVYTQMHIFDPLIECEAHRNPNHFTEFGRENPKKWSEHIELHDACL